ncbi:MAG TPA: tRNA guanosine(34) transglycosylase Tgt [Bacteroidales bacterium]|nr:tRNA guanosine(34) transglycosylase Tgt [Bacteroidales bacterium]
MKYTLTAKDPGSSARAGIIETAHGLIETPVFMPVGTAGSVKAIHQKDLHEDIKARIILGNTYHLYLRPGLDVLNAAGGLHKFNGWNKPILTDSGGYQVYSLKTIRKIKEDGVVFQSHIDGSKHIFTPENNIDIQRKIGADIMMAFDECTPFPCEYDYAKKSMKMTHKWLERGVRRFRESEPLYGYEQSLFPIVQGSTFSDLRKIAAETVASYDLDGNAIGGLSVGEPADVMYEITGQVCSILPHNKPRYLMGVGTPANILEGIALGVDMFDCVMPTRNGRNGWLFTKKGRINIRNEKWKNDFSPVDDKGCSFVDTHYSKAYLRHLFVSNEILASMIASQHNLAFYLWLVTEARHHILKGDFLLWKNEMISGLERKL